MKIINLVGARPQFVKAALVSAELRRRQCVEVLVHSGQHYDYEMSDVFFSQLHIPAPAYHLEVGSGSHAVQTAKMMERLEPIVVAEDPSWVLVYGDTNTTLAGALVAAKLNVPLAHVEAGLRSFNRYMPEEINRIVVDHLANMHFSPNRSAANQLAAEGITDRVVIAGDLMIDLLKKTVGSLPERPKILDRFQLQAKRYAVATVHRASNTEGVETLERIASGLRSIGLPVVFPIHPRTREVARALNLGAAGDSIIPCEPLPYEEMIALQRDAGVILTDSGGMQKEAYALRVPCVTLREETEWVETLENGCNVLVGSDPRRIEQAAKRKLSVANFRTLYGEGVAAQSVVESLIAESDRGNVMGAKRTAFA
jgi:UDP-GlcNAc3NAcA epimerase